MRYYFVSYVKLKRNGMKTMDFFNGVIPVHPLRWQMNREDSVYQRIVISWIEITQQEYSMFEDEFKCTLT